MALFVRLDEFNVSLEHRVDEVAQRKAAGFCACSEKCRHLRIKADRLDEQSSTTIETTTLRFREIVFFFHGISDIVSVRGRPKRVRAGFQRVAERLSAEYARKRAIPPYLGAR